MTKNISKGWIPTTGMILVMAVGAFANGGVVVGNIADNTCTAASEKSIADTIKDFIKDIIGADVKAPASCEERVDSGVVVGG